MSRFERNNLNEIISKIKIDTVYDVGANHGQWYKQHKHLFPSATVCCFEANPTIKRPKHIAKTDKWFNVALSSPETKQVEFYSVNGTGDSYYKERTTAYSNCKPITLPTTSLDEFVAEQNLTAPTLLKLDTQGSELDILKGAATTLRNTKIVVMEIPTFEYNLGAPTFDEYISFMLDNDFLLVGLDGIHHIDEILVQLDVVFIHSTVKEALFGPTKFLVDPN